MRQGCVALIDKTRNKIRQVTVNTLGCTCIILKVEQKW